MKVLAIDSSNQTLALALCEDERLIGQLTNTTKRTHSVTLMPAINQLFAQSQMKPAELDRIVVASGPGSYTGLRIGVTTAKTLAWSLGIELVSVSSLASLAANSLDYSGYLVPIFDARRENVYSGVYQWQAGKLIEVLSDRHVALSSWLSELKQLNGDVRFVGSDVAVFKEIILAKFPATTLTNVPQLNEVNGVGLAQLGMEAAPVADINAFVPRYLKLVEAEEKWLEENHEHQRADYVEKI